MKSTLAWSWLWRGIALLVAIYVVGVLALMWWWSYEPAHFDVVATAHVRAAAKNEPVVTGSVTTSALMTCGANPARQAWRLYQQRQVPARRADGQRAELGIRRAHRDARPRARDAQQVRALAVAVRGRRRSQGSRSAVLQPERPLAAAEFRRASTARRSITSTAISPGSARTIRTARSSMRAPTTSPTISIWCRRASAACRSGFRRASASCAWKAMRRSMRTRRPPRRGQQMVQHAVDEDRRHLLRVARLHLGAARTAAGDRRSISRRSSRARTRRSAWSRSSASWKNRRSRCTARSSSTAVRSDSSRTIRW